MMRKHPERLFKKLKEKYGVFLDFSEEKEKKMSLITVNASTSISLALYYTKKNRAETDLRSRQLASGMVFDKAGDGYAAEWLITDNAYYKQKLAAEAESNLDTGSKIIGNAVNAMSSIKDMVQQLRSIVQSMATKQGDNNSITGLKTLAGNFFDVMKSMQTEITQASDFNGINMLTKNDGLTLQMDNFSTIHFAGLQLLGTDEDSGGVLHVISNFLSDANDVTKVSNRLKFIEYAFGGKSYINVKDSKGQLQKFALTKFAGSNNQYTALLEKAPSLMSLKSSKVDTNPFGISGTEKFHSNMTVFSQAAGAFFSAKSKHLGPLAVSVLSAGIIAKKIKSHMGGLLELRMGQGIFAGLISENGKTPETQFWTRLQNINSVLTHIDDKIQGHEASYGIYQSEVGILQKYKADRADTMQQFADNIKMINPDIAATAKALAATRLQIAQQVVAFQVSNYGQSIQQISGQQ